MSSDERVGCWPGESSCSRKARIPLKQKRGHLSVGMKGKQKNNSPLHTQKWDLRAERNGNLWMRQVLFFWEQRNGYWNPLREPHDGSDKSNWRERVSWSEQLHVALGLLNECWASSKFPYFYQGRWGRWHTILMTSCLAPDVNKEGRQ